MRGIVFNGEDRAALLAAGFNYRTLWAWRRGLRFPNSSMMRRIHDVLGDRLFAYSWAPREEFDQGLFLTRTERIRLARAGFNHGSICRWRRHGVRPDYASAVAIGRVLGRDVVSEMAAWRPRDGRLAS